MHQRIVEAEAQIADYGGITGWAGLNWLGAVYADGSTNGAGVLPVPLAIGGGNLRAHEGMVPSKERLAPHDLITVDGLRLTRGVRSTCYEMRYAESVRAAVRWLEIASYNDVASIAEVADYARGLNGWTGIPQLREALPFCDENSWSPTETDMRLVWVLDAGCSRPLCNPAIFDPAGRHIGTPDLLDPTAGLVGEYDGALHLQGAMRSRDVRREAAYRRLGLEYVTMLAGDRADPTAFVGRLREAYSRARFLPDAAREWTLVKPHWWVPTETVEQRRALSGGQRRRLLRLRAG